MVTNLFPPKFGGAAIQSLQLSGALRELGFEPEYFTDHDGQPGRWDTYQDLRVFRARTLLSKPSPLKQLLYTLRLALFLTRHPGYPLVHFHALLGYETLLFPFLKAAGKRVLVKLTLAGSDDPLTLKRRKGGALFLWGLRRADRLIAISESLSKLSAEAGFPPEKVERIPNGVNVERFSPPDEAQRLALRARMGVGPDVRVFLSMGKVEERKGYRFLLEAWKTLQAAFPGAQLWIAGPGNTEENAYYRELIRMIADEDLRGVRFLGEVRNTEECFKVSDCFLFCSRQEGFGNVLVEAMSCRVPVVTTDIEGITADIVTEPGIGRICRSSSPADFAGMTVRFLAEADPASKKRASDAIRARFDIRAIARRYAALYAELLRKGERVS